MKERYNKHEIAVIVLFVGILFAMLFGMAAPSVCRRLGISLPGTGKNDAANEASQCGNHTACKTCSEKRVVFSEQFLPFFPYISEQLSIAKTCA